MYGGILPVACIILALRYVFMDRASIRSKCAVCVVSLVSFTIPWRIVAILVQLVVSIYVLLYLKVLESDRRSRLHR